MLSSPYQASILVKGVSRVIKSKLELTIIMNYEANLILKKKYYKANLMIRMDYS
jgi:hypothetical protein